ncbi:bifunctional metallophosphatase/5'-nucleotidase [Weissella coleopterorum]|uniref:bifunctional metallophosphatase/5'-nucleotidase n=1 Tax=Weissella coleopterorum TaxID=2714949 RepID=UPI001FEBD6D5|nr:bifunctional UDP-sugar hydrolase/5'-nucleotidase [Weissella coleopterorum]
MIEKITILHTNDMHSHLERWPQIRHFLNSYRKQLLRRDETVLTFDVGDAMDRNHVLTEASQGRANINLLNGVHYDGVTIGNNEGLSLSHTDLNQLYEHANFPILLANLLDNKTNQIPKWAHPYEIITTKNGTRIGVIGMTAPFTLTYPLLGWQPLPVVATLKMILKELAGKTDLNILLSHLGLPTDRHLADQFPEVQIILGAHTHHHLPKGEWRNQTLLAAAGRYGEHIGQVQLEIEDGQFRQAKASTIDVELLPKLTRDAETSAQYQDEGAKMLSQKKVADIPQAFQRGINAKYRLIDLGLEALKARTETDLAMLSTGMFLTDLPTGPVSMYELHQMLPHAVHPMRTKLKGKEVIRLMREVKKNRNYLLGSPVYGMGFRGGKWGEIVWSGLELTNDDNVLVHGQPINLAKDYYIGGLDHYLFFPYFPTLEIMGKNELSYDTVLREDFASYLAQQFPLKK